MIIDLCDDSNLNKENKKIFKYIIHKNSKNFSNLISNSSKAYHNNLDWWVSLSASRNNFSSDLFYNFCICEFIKYLILQNKKISKILINSKSVGNILEEIFEKKNLKIKIIINSTDKRYKLKKYKSFLSLNFFFIYIRTVYYQLIKLAFGKLSKIYLNKKLLLKKKSHINRHLSFT